MIIDTEVSIALKNSVGQYDMKRISIFKINKVTEIFKYIYLASVSKKEIQFKIKCSICGEYHYYSYDVMSFLRGSMTIGGCENLGYPIFFIGQKEKVEDKINKYREVNENIYVMI
ncbi:hypothetical protein Z959_06300 [Clostridium novyi B str. ATCC 27606]|uniref:Uncharacterized protein n=2 Tax=Clostridium TaxID=1485 RepID=A0AA40M696_CLONO|nr:MULTISPECIES: hypothetical protein [Clostridium]AYF54160.1 hypothetical protein DFH04_05235 [Clostridium novyi]KEI12955.1 hypothetical protein Z958_05040 [Clostridium novyi B str. NCTC 9691]KEI17516.1 hypothetical protein Z960_06085 [Clostridium haemolyticum NCTC 9693]KEI17695.1 hypothetical protein Z959_06300 [Clostridium novyi B str. ATCC 27606]KGN04273.1 hypothetical protein Z961_04105 [Clostridium haemolyticum NCTC 8350]